MRAVNDGDARVCDDGRSGDGGGSTVECGTKPGVRGSMTNVAKERVGLALYRSRWVGAGSRVEPELRGILLKFGDLGFCPQRKCAGTEA
jgi:hypothetical protein